MNFKDAYKSCNDDISGNREILASILSGDVKKKRKNFNFRPVFACVVLAVVITSAAIYGYDMLGEEPYRAEKIASNDGMGPNRMFDYGIDEKNNSQDNTDALNDSANTAPIQSENPQMLADPGTSGGHSVSEDSKSEISGDKTSGVDDALSEQNESDDLNKEYVTESPQPVIVEEPVPAASDYGQDSDFESESAYDGLAYSEEVTENEVSEEIPENESQEKSSNWSGVAPSSASRASGGGSSGGGGGGSSKSVTVNAIATEYITPESYFDYLGINVTGNSVLPADMSFAIPENIKIERKNGVIVADEVAFAAYSADDSMRTVRVRVSKTNAYAEQFVSGKNVPVVVSGSNGISAYMMAGDVSVYAISSGMTEDELLVLIKSLKK